MKRPLLLYIVGVWCFCGLATQVSVFSRLIASHFAEGQAFMELRNTLSGVGCILVIWHVFRLIQLKAFNRWFSIVFFGLWTMTLTWNSFMLAQRFEKPQRAIPALLTFAVFNVASIWYLVRRSFRVFAIQFVSEREKEQNSRMMQKISRKKIQSGLQS
jgi:hypothetical protein